RTKLLPHRQNRPRPATAAAGLPPFDAALALARNLLLRARPPRLGPAQGLEGLPAWPLLEAPQELARQRIAPGSSRRHPPQHRKSQWCCQPCVDAAYPYEPPGANPPYS